MPTADLEKQVKALTQRVQELEDIENIKKLHRDYLFWISNLEFDKALGCFTDDVTVDVANYGLQTGIENVTKFFNETIFKNVKISKDAHFTGQAVVNVKGKKAEGHWMFYRLLARPTQPGWVQGRYDCEYVKTKKGWKFSFLKMKRPWPAFFAEKD